MARRHLASYSEPGLRDEVLDLLAAVFPFFREQEIAARRLGLAWEQCSTPFVHRAAGSIVAHVGVLEMPLVTDAGERTVGSVHAVATHPEHRRRGYFRSIMDEVLAWSDARYETLQLCTDNPEFFEDFGFRILEEHRFAGERRSSGGPRDLVPLEDPALLRRLLGSRDPVSHRLGVRDRHVFLFNEARHPLHYAPELDAVLSFDVDEGTLELWDIVSPRLPSLDRVLDVIGPAFDRVEVHFAPDRLEAALEPVADAGDDGVLMARGPYPAEGRPFKLPVTARC